MLGLWEAGAGPQQKKLHVAFAVDLDHLLQAADHLREADIIPLDFAGKPTDEPVVFAWMPAASLFFHDPDGNLLECFRCCLILRNAISESSDGVAGSRLKGMKLALRGAVSALEPIESHY